ncbi:MAG: hypothetical protein LBH06_09735 [Rikenellaceae bacterium]|nr:hypothetical protein [Rikenellaceae bacterium]
MRSYLKYATCDPRASKARFQRVPHFHPVPHSNALNISALIAKRKEESKNFRRRCEATPRCCSLLLVLTESLNARSDELRLMPLLYVGLFAAKPRGYAGARKSVEKSAQRGGVKKIGKPIFSLLADDFSFYRAGAAFGDF